MNISISSESVQKAINLFGKENINEIIYILLTDYREFLHKFDVLNFSKYHYSYLMAGIFLLIENNADMPEINALRRWYYDRELTYIDTAEQLIKLVKAFEYVEDINGNEVRIFGKNGEIEYYNYDCDEYVQCGPSDFLNIFNKELKYRTIK